MANVKKQLVFDASNPADAHTLEILNKSPRVASKLVTLAINELCTKYNLDGSDVDGKEIRDFLKMYPRIKNLPTATQEVFPRTLPLQREVPEQEEEAEPVKTGGMVFRKLSNEEKMKNLQGWNAIEEGDEE